MSFSLPNPPDKFEQKVIACTVIARQLFDAKQRFAGLGMTPKEWRQERRRKLAFEMAQLISAHNQIAEQHNAMLLQEQTPDGLPIIGKTGGTVRRKIPILEVRGTEKGNPQIARL